MILIMVEYQQRVSSDISLYHQRLPYDPADNTHIFAPYFASEKPSPESILALDDQIRHLLHQRHRAKRAIDLEGNPILNHTPLDMSRYAPQPIIDARIAAAKEVVESWMNDVFVGEFAAHLHRQLVRSPGRIITFTQIVSVGLDRYNFLASVYEDTLIETLRQIFARAYPDDKVLFDRFTVPIVSVPKRTESTPIQRLTRQPYLDLEATKEGLTGKRLVLLDDHVQSGGTFATFLSIIKQPGQGTEVLGITALSTHPTLRNLTHAPDVEEVLMSYADKQSLDKSGNHELDNILSVMRLSIATLTNREALYLIGMMMDGRNTAEREAYFDLIRRISQGVMVPEGKEDNFEQFSNTPPMTLGEIFCEINELVEERAMEIKARMKPSSTYSIYD